jgi:hypothetical protein
VAADNSISSRADHLVRYGRTAALLFINKKVGTLLAYA